MHLKLCMKSSIEAFLSYITGHQRPAVLQVLSPGLPELDEPHEARRKPLPALRPRGQGQPRLPRIRRVILRLPFKVSQASSV